MSCAPPPSEFRQAVVLIHGIGEERPMDTLRSFVRGVAGAGYQFLGKPDRVSDSVELYRLSAHEQSDIPRTDFYEFYWAHLMEGTTWAHVTAWLRVLMVRSPSHVPVRLQGYWWSLWVALGVAAAAAWIFFPGSTAAISLGLLGWAGAWLLRAVAGTFGLHYVGDAARYLSPAPGNIRVRHAIRTEALNLLRGLHENPHHPTQHYDRIVVVGHSLGSVIAYDALRYLWQEVHSYPGRLLPVGDDGRQIQPSAIDLQQPELVAAEGVIAAGEISTAEYLQQQRALWDEQRRLGIAWKVTDLVTLGSPLTYAEFLMADGREDLTRRQHDREYPMCPPQPKDQRDGGLLCKHAAMGDRDVTLRVLHHAALFACTRWTNLYYASDIIGGPVAPQFGRHVVDCELVSPTSAPTSHVRYWDRAGKDALDELRRALRLNETSAPAAAD
jgi:hypothetical protein